MRLYLDWRSIRPGGLALLAYLYDVARRENARSNDRPLSADRARFALILSITYM
jgi:hypothetical protein